eukprot:SM000004S14989  [mRNA]  locus=s4:631812:637205:+ [translate_table: standard]
MLLVTVLKLTSLSQLTSWVGLNLKLILGEGLDQKGSLVAEDRLRFDFSYNKPIDAKDLGKIEKLVLRDIERAQAVYAKEASLAEARQIVGLRAVFGEVYPDPVRVVAIGTPVETLLADPKNPAWNEVSTEFCGAYAPDKSTEAGSDDVNDQTGYHD